ncbi:DUF6308 family protein [Euzebya pacifica]|uniref:DUF6308 family protein n=1 Tax=Euzebya pacifica TaxID=1608957 RepID=UPI0030F83814
MRTGLDRLLNRSSDTSVDISSYLDPDKAYARDRFDRLQPNDPHEISPSDLLAVTLLDLSTPIDFLTQLLSPSYGGAGRLDALLRDVPTNVPLWNATDADLRAADAAWNVINGIHGVGWVRAGKLMARKRPLLIPIWDTVVRSFFGEPTAVWASFREVLRDDRLRERLWTLAPADWPQDMSLLRLVDIAAWMYRR